MPEAPEQSVDHDAIAAALRGLTDADLVRLRASAATLVELEGLDLTVDDLQNEAVCRLLADRRKWSPHMALGPLLVGIMRSIAGDQRRLAYSQNEVVETDLSVSELMGWENTLSRTQNPEGGFHREAIIDRVLDALAKDPPARDVFQGQLMGFSRQELLATLQWEAREYDTVNRRLKRFLAAFGQQLENDNER